jgi:hypothetical protein
MASVKPTENLSKKSVYTFQEALDNSLVAHMRLYLKVLSHEIF